MAFEVADNSEFILQGQNLNLTIPKKKFRCSKGHQWEDTGRTEMSVFVAGEEKAAFSFCPFCYLDWFKANITPAEEIKEADNGF